jgi:tetratricopeptide (TPR) repeat protein
VFNEFNAYFNTYYNAKETFAQVEEVVQGREKAEKFLTIEKIDDEIQIPPNEKNKLDDVIKKCSKILQYYINTSIADDALLMIGKSYLYQDNYLAAERKFAELISNFPRSDLYNEALYYLMLTLVKEKKYADAVMSFQTKANPERRKNLGKLYKIYAVAKFKLGEVDSAINYLKLALNNAKGEDKAEILFYLGEVNELKDRAESAKFYYESAKHTKRQNLKAWALIKYSIQKRELGEYDIALRALNDLLEQGFDADYARRIYLELARTYNHAGKIDKAIQTYVYLDTTYKRTEESAYGYFELGRLYEERIGNYDSAKFFFDKARLENPQSDVSKIAQKKIEQYNNYFKYISVISKTDSVSVEQLADAKYSLAWLFYMEFGRLDSAIHYLNDVIKNHPNSSASARAYYLLGTIYEPMDSQKAREIYTELIRKFPETQYAKQAMKILGVKNDVEKDTLEELYNIACSMIDTNPQGAIDLFLRVYNQSVDANLKARAFFAIGWINEYKLKNYSKAIEYYTKILDNFPNTEYAKIVSAKVNPDKQEEKPKQPQITPEVKPKQKESDSELEDEMKTRDRRRKRIDDN